MWVRTELPTAIEHGASKQWGPCHNCRLLMKGMATFSPREICLLCSASRLKFGDLVYALRQMGFTFLKSGRSKVMGDGSQAFKLRPSFPPIHASLVPCSQLASFVTSHIPHGVSKTF